MVSALGAVEGPHEQPRHCDHRSAAVLKLATPRWMVSTLGLLLWLVVGPFTGCRTRRRPTMTLPIAASLQDAIAEVETSYQREHGADDFRNNFGSSGTLAREIEEGAPVDAIISAGTKPLDDLQAKGLFVPGTRINLLGNSLVLIAPQGSRLTGFEGLLANVFV